MRTKITQVLLVMGTSLSSALAYGQTVELLGFTRFGDASAPVDASFKLCRQVATDAPLEVGYELRGPGLEHIDLSDGAVSIEPHSQCATVEFSVSSAPTSDETLSVTVSPRQSYAINPSRQTIDFVITAQTPTPAFVGAEGAAKYIGSEVSAHTWRGKGVYFVENLNAQGAGSLSQAFLDAKNDGGGYIIPRVAGVIDASETRLNLRAMNGVYFAGQAGPGPLLILGADNGCVTFSDSKDLLVRYLSVLHQPPTAESSLDAIEIFNATDVYLNHIDAGRGIDEAMSAVLTNFERESGRITIDWNLFMEMDPAHTTGSLTGGLGSGREDQRRGPRAQIPTLAYSYNKNLTVDISHRFPNVSGYGHWEVANNVLANHRYRWMQLSYPQPKVGALNNYIKPGPVTLSQFDTDYWVVGNRFSRTAYTFDDQQMSKMYIAGTVMEGYHDPEVDDDWVFNTHFFDREFLGMPVPRAQELPAPPQVYGSTQVWPAAIAYERVTGPLGAGNSARLEGDGGVREDRIAYMQALVARVRAGEMSTSYPTRASWVTPPVSSGSPYEDSDRDGMGDAWERASGLNVGVDDHAGRDLDPRRDNLEVFLDNVAPTSPCPQECTPGACPPGCEEVDVLDPDMMEGAMESAMDALPPQPMDEAPGSRPLDPRAPEDARAPGCACHSVSGPPWMPTPPLTIGLFGVLLCGRRRRAVDNS